MKPTDQPQCVVCERSFDPPKKEEVKPPPLRICSSVCAGDYNKLKLVKSVSFGVN
jgi:hypothetical protein